MDGYGKRILVVDDDENTAFLISTLLECSGYNVTAVSNGVEALRELGRRHFDAIITDYAMPLLNGAELLKRIRVQYPETPVIFVSGHPSEFLDAIDPPPFAYIRKPYDSDALLKLVRSAVHVPSAPTAVSF
jgi:two-component system chemotaxis response regulator CheY